MTRNHNDLDYLCINTIRMLAIDGIQKANSGHPGMPMGTADMAYVLWTQFLKHNPANPSWPDRDRFVLSAGHGSMLLYSLLHLTGYDLPLDELKNFRQWGSRTPGHPEHGLAPGVEVTTGPLGQGFATGVGMAIAERFLAAHFNRPGHTIVDHFTYAIVSDGDLMEGVSHEAASLAGHLRLGKLIYLYDDNDISIEGSTDLTFTEDVGARFQAYGWHVQYVDGYDLRAIADAIRAAQAETTRPSLIIARTHIGFGSPHKQDTAEVHGAPLGEEEVRLTKQNLGWPEEPPFFIPDQALVHFRQAVKRGHDWEADWQKRFEAYAAAYPDLAAEWQMIMNGELPPGWDADLPVFKPEDGPIATRVASGKTLNALAPRLPTLIGGSADLAPSNNTYLKGLGDFAADTPHGRNLHFGVREHVMGAILNGLALHGGVIPYGGTFLVFSDYMRPAIRLAAMMELPVVYVFTHDSIGIGEDGPTHQPIEQLASLRAVPGLTVIRPADANETVEAWRVALTRRQGPVALALTRQSLPTLDRTKLAPADALARGAYILAEAESDQPEIIIIASGSEVHVALGARELLARRGVAARVVNMPSWELFERQPQDYRDAVLPPAITARLAVEAGVAQGWHRYVGPAGDVVSIERFGASAPYKVLWEKFGFTAENVAARALALLE
ncbi:MAG: transketolase [Anaerolineae bacterium]|jgi:transketolase|nr:transketolase [Anaerolineae bacterium]MDH7474925.1 transketolase [Anaerolineae bacterium]